MNKRIPAEWVAMDDEHTNEPTIYAWGDWYIAQDINGGLWHLIVTTGIEYGPFCSLEDAKRYAEDVRGD